MIIVFGANLTRPPNEIIDVIFTIRREIEIYIYIERERKREIYISARLSQIYREIPGGASVASTYLETFEGTS